MLDYLSA